MSESKLIGKKRKFTKEEDMLLKKLVEIYGTENWSKISSQLPDRSAKQCRYRYNDYLSKTIIEKKWTREEDEMLLEKIKAFGHCWIKLCFFFPGRSANNLKNRWHKYLKGSICSKTTKQPFVDQLDYGSFLYKFLNPNLLINENNAIQKFP